MKRLAASILALGLIAATSTAMAQSSEYSDPVRDRSVQNDAPYYDYGKVIRVDPVITSGYSNTPASSQRCYTEDGYYTDEDDRGYDDRYARNDYGRDRYGDDRYRDDRYGDDRDGDGRYGRDNGGNDRAYGTETGRNVATVIGGIVGAALGSKVGGGSARYATAAIGSMVGGMAGREVYESAQRKKEPKMARVTVCDPIRDGSRPVSNPEVTSYDVTYEYAGRQHVARTNYHPGDRIRIRVDVRAE
ncbi:MAG: glycine zipper 2TM domain-containing protein [Lysobacteraceae bacterium]|nr:MAG: glycine zipper 2TM domain-containing protein [Xanthomonadaceae bacterium]